MIARVSSFVLILGLAAPSQAASPALQRVVAAAHASGYLEPRIVAAAEQRCATALCFANFLAERLPARVRLERTVHPDTDTIRWVRTRPSIEAVERDVEGLVRLRLSHFGRKALGEMQTLLERRTGGIPNFDLEIDLRGNPGGDFERMLALAGLLIGPRPDSVDIRRRQVSERRALSGPLTRRWTVRRVIIDETTDSAALILARILTRQGGATLIGVDEKPETVFVKRRIAIAQNWRLVIPIALVSSVGN